MPKKAKEMTATAVRRLSRPGLYAVGGVSGLQLQVTESGAKSWILRYKLGSRRRDLGLGAFPDVPLVQAREAARAAKEKIRDGIDPIDERRALRAERLTALARQMTFKDAAERCYRAKAPEFRNAKHSAQWLTTLETYAYPKIGSLLVSEIELPHVLSVLEPIWHEKTETAKRVRQRLESVLSWAAVSGYRSGDNPARWDANLSVILPTPAKLQKVKHHRALPHKEMPGFMADLRQLGGMGARALEFAILTGVRSGEVRGAMWGEVDLDEKLWIIPGERMKTGKEHRVPLSREAIKLLKGLPRFEDTPHIFPAPRGGALSDMSLSAVTRRMGVDAVPHGFRSTFRDWCAECTAYPHEVAEQALAHAIPSAVERAYRRGDLLNKRRRLMEDWAKFLSTPAGQKGEVVGIRARRR